MRKSRQETAETRARIVAAAAVQFREHGIDGTGLADLMGAAGMTHGGFYKHFASKEQLVGEAAQFALAERLAAFEAYLHKRPPHARLAALVNAYLSVEHCDNRAAGCPMAALGNDLARAGTASKDAAMTQFRAFIALIESCIAPARPDRPGTAMAIASALVGAMTLARVAPDPALATQILASARTHILASWAAA